MIHGETRDMSLCDWHLGVFARLYAVLVHPDAVCRETECAACGERDVCRFEVSV